MDKIRLLLIDDNPRSLMNDAGPESFYPRLDFGYSDSEFPRALVTQHFELGWLQSPRDVVEFRTFTEGAVQRYGQAALVQQGFVPEVVLFDYMLKDGISNFIDYDLPEYKTLFPTYQLSQALGRPSHRFVDWASRAPELATLTAEAAVEHPEAQERDHAGLAKSKIKRDLFRSRAVEEPALFSSPRDDMGCYAGGLIALQFKDHPCVGVPITSKAAETDVSPDALYFEWLLSEDFDNTFGRKYGRHPYWNEILPQATKLLRKRIETLVRVGKVTPSYHQLNELTTGTSGDGVFSFVSPYGERHLPLAGLFLGEIEPAANWATRLVASLPTQGAELGSAIRLADTLWTTYVERFGDRIDLSDYEFRANGGGLSPEENKAFATLKASYGVNDGRFDTEISIESVSKKEGAVASTRRLAVLHLLARASIGMRRCSTAAPNSAFYGELSDREKLNVLFPFYNLKPKSGSLLLPMHAPRDWTSLSNRGRKWLADNLNLRGTNRTVTQANCLDPQSWITNGERILLKSLLYEGRQFFPQWLQ